MKIRKILAAVAAAAVAVSMTAVNALAINIMDYVGADMGCLYLTSNDANPAYAVDAGIDPAEIYGIRFYAVLSDDYSGAVCWNGASCGWNQADFTGESTGDIVVDKDAGTVTWLRSKPCFKSNDAYAQIQLRAWSGTAPVTNVEILDKDGNVIEAKEAAPAEETPSVSAPTEEAAPAAEETSAPDTTTAPVATGNTAAASVAAVMAVAGVAAIASRKRK